MTYRAFIMGYNTLGLRYAENDLKLIQNALVAHGYETSSPELDVSFEDKKSILIKSLDVFLDSCGLSDTVIIYFSGHAFAPKGELLLLINDDLKRINASTIRFNYLTSAIEHCAARNKLLILDCCHALSDISNWRPPQSEQYRILAASGKLEKAKEIKSLCASFLTHYIYYALTESYSELIQNKRDLTVNDLYEWLAIQTKNYNKNQIESVPTPKLVGDQGNDFILCESKERALPIQISKYLGQISCCLSDCRRECYGRYPWCRINSELGLISSFYVVPQVKYSVNGGNITQKRLDDFFVEWLKNENETHLAILGDSGIGKSSACIFFTSKLAIDSFRNQQNGLIPIFLSLEGLARQGLLGSDVVTILKKSLYINLEQSELSDLLGKKKLVFILDGFDEISDKADHSRIIKNLNELKPILFSGCKTVLTCRTHFFVNQEQVEQVLIGGTNVGTELYEALREKSTGFKVVELQEFSESEIKSLIRKRQGENQEGIWETIKKLYNLEDLARRPLLLSLILQTLPKLMRRRSEINRAEIYKAYTDFWFRREAERIEIDIDIQKKQRFIEYLSIEMWTRNVVSIKYDELQEKIRKEYANEISSITDLYSRYYDTQNASFLNRDNEGFYRFMHKSFMEYFFAQSCVRSLTGNGELELWDIRWFDKEVAGFISEILGRRRHSPKIKILTNQCLNTSRRTILWNALHTLSLIGRNDFETYVGGEILNSIIEQAECEQNAVILRQYCRIIAKFDGFEKSQEMIRKLLFIVGHDYDQNVDNNDTYINYYYGKASACEALLGHLSTEEPKYDRELHIYVLGEIGEVRHAERLAKLLNEWVDIEHVKMAQLAVEKIYERGE